MDSGEAVKSILAAAQLMQVELGADCVKAIELAVSATGFEQGAVTAAGSVLVRDANGRDAWLCQSR